MRRVIVNTGRALVVLATALTATAAAETPAETMYRWLVQYCRVIPEPDQQWECWTALARESMGTMTQAQGTGRRQ